MYLGQVDHVKPEVLKVNIWSIFSIRKASTDYKLIYKKYTESDLLLYFIVEL